MSKKLIVIGLSAILGLFLLVSPVIAIGAVILKPFQTISEFFLDLGDFVFGSGKNNQVLDLIEAYLSTDKSQSYLQENYISFIRNEKDIRVPLNYLVIPNMLAGIEYPTDEMILTQINAMKLKSEKQVPLYDKDGKPVLDKNGKQMYETVVEYSVRTVNDYLNVLRKSEPWATNFSTISSQTISNYVNSFASLSIYEGLDPDYLAQFADGEFSYPFTEKAVVTAEFGRYSYKYNGVWYFDQPHNAIDLAFSGKSACGIPIYAVYDGVVINKQGSDISKTGNFGYVQNGDIVVRYVHMAEAFVYNIGDEIHRGDYIGTIGATGIATGCHLHLAIYVQGTAVNPRNFIDFDNPFGN